MKNKFEVEELETQKVWLFGYKLRHQEKFDIEIVYTEKRKQKLWDYHSKNNNHFFIQEIQIPVYIKKEVTPF